MIADRSTPIPTTVEQLLGRGLAQRLDRLDLLSRKIFAGKLPGERRSKRRGRSVEFDDYRTYVAGDDLRHIDWNVLARLDKFFVKLFREDQDLSLHLVLDASPSMDAGNPSKLVYTHQLAMALGYVGLVNQNRVALTIFRGPGTPLTSLAPVRGRPNARRLATTLLNSLNPGRAGVPTRQATPVADFNAALRAVAMSRSGRGVMVVISDFLHREGWRSGLNYLFGSETGGFDTWCLHTLSPGELDPAKERENALVGDLRLTDVETGQGAEVTISARLLAKYKSALTRHCESLRADCRARGMTYLLVSTQTPIDALVLDSLRRLGMLR